MNLIECHHHNNNFDYHNIKNALCGQINSKDIFICRKIMIIQMKMTSEEKELKRLKQQLKNNRREENFTKIMQDHGNELKLLESWLISKNVGIIFDSEIDDWNEKTSVFNKYIIGKDQLVFLIESEDGEMFGHYLNTTIDEVYGKNMKTDENSFHFTLKFKNKRIERATKYEIKDFEKGGYWLLPNDNKWLIKLGDIVLSKHNTKEKSYCCQSENTFDYHGIKNALCGKTKYKENNEWKGDEYTPKRILVFQMEANELKRFQMKELERQRNEMIEKEKLRHKLIQENPTKQIEEWTNLFCSETIFDSDIDDWSSSEILNKRIKGRNKLLFLIESEDDETFGYYLSTTVTSIFNKKNKTDSQSFHFNLKSNGRLAGMKKFEINELEEGYVLFRNTDLQLIQLGDIILFTKQNKNESFCRFQYDNNFNYQNIENAICGKTGWKNPFVPKRITVVQMNISEVEKQAFEIKQQQEIIDNTLYTKQLEEWTELKWDQTVFDSKIDKWSQNRSLFNQKIIGKKQLVFLIENLDGEVFGYYLNTQVNEQYKYSRQETDSKTFHFNLKSNGRFPNPMKFEIKDLEKGGIKLFQDSDEHLITIGDIELLKENRKNLSFCSQHEYLFDYHNVQFALCEEKERYYSKNYFFPTRIRVIQMI